MSVLQGLAFLRRGSLQAAHHLTDELFLGSHAQWPVETRVFNLVFNLQLNSTKSS